MNPDVRGRIHGPSDPPRRTADAPQTHGERTADGPHDHHGTHAERTHKRETAMSAPDGSPVGAERSIGQLFATATTELSALVHDEIALAKAQLKRDVKRGAMS